MNGLIRHLMLTAQARTGFSPQALICTAVAALWAAIAVGFGLLAAFILLAQRFGSLTAGLALARLFLVIAVIAGVTALLIRRRTIARARRELAARGNAHSLDPRLRASACRSAKRWVETAGEGRGGRRAGGGSRQGVGRACIARYALTAMSYQRPMIHFAPTTVCQTATNSTVRTMMAASRAIESRTPSSSR